MSNFSYNSFFSKYFYLFLFLITVFFAFIYTYFLNRVPYYWNINNEFPLIIDQLIINSGYIPAHIDSPGFGFYLLNLIISKILYKTGNISFLGINELDSAIDPFILIAEFIQTGKLVMPIFTLIFVTNILTSLAINFSSKSFLLLTTILLLSMDGLIYSNIFLGIDLYLAIYISFYILFISLAIKFYGRKYNYIFNILAGLFWGLGFLTYASFALMVLPIFIMLFYNYEIATPREQDSNQAPNRFVFLLLTIFLIVLFVIARFFKIMEVVSLPKPIWGISLSSIFVIFTMIIFNTKLRRTIENFTKTPNLTSIIFYSVLGMILSFLVHFFTPIGWFDSLAYLLNDIRCKFFLNKSDVSFTYMKSNLGIMPEYFLALTCLLLMCIYHFYRFKSNQFLIGFTLLILGGFTLRYNISSSHFITQMILSLAILVISSRLWLFSRINKIILTLVFAFIIAGNFSRISHLENNVYSASRGEGRKIEEFVRGDFVGNEVHFLLTLEKAYTGLDNILKPDLVFTLNHLKSINSIKKDLSNITDGKINLQDVSMLNHKRRIFNEVDGLTIKNMPQALKNSLAIDLSNVKVKPKKSTMRLVKSFSNTTRKEFLSISPRFDKEIYLFSLEKLKPSEYIQETNYQIEMENKNRDNKKYYGYKLTKYYELPKIIEKSNCFLVVKNF